MNEFSPKDCPVGISNAMKIEKVKDKFDMAIQRMEEKLNDMDEKMDKGFSDVNKNISKLEKRFDDLDEKLPEKIDERIKLNRNSNSWQIVKWVLVTLCGSIAVSVLTRLVLNYIG